MTQPPQPNRSQSSTSLSRLYNGPNSLGRAEDNDPALDFCNSFWGPGDKGYEVLMARLRGATRTIDEIRAFWKERIAIEEEYAKKLAKLSKTTVGRDEIGDLQGCLKHVLNETGQQASFHAALSQELRESVEGPTAEFGNRLANLRKGLQGSVEKAYKNKGLQEGHVNKAKERYESDCLKLNSYTANLNLVQGKEVERIQQKLAKVQQTIGANEQDFRQFVRVTEGTVMKWEGEWKSFCDDLEEDRLAMTKDIIWAYANAVSQVCVEDDGSCERIREKLEQFESQNDMVTFVRGWGTGDSIPGAFGRPGRLALSRLRNSRPESGYVLTADPPRFINYAAGEVFSSHPTSHPARFERISSKPLGAPPPSRDYQEQHASEPEANHQPDPVREERNIAPPIAPPNGDPQTGLPDMRNLNINDGPQKTPSEQQHKPFGGVALPGMAAPPTPSQSHPERQSSMGPPPVPSSTMSMPEPRAPSRQSQMVNNVNDEEDPMVKALANLRKEPPPPDSIRRNPSNRRPESVYSHQGSVRNGVNPPASPGPGAGSFRGAPSPGPGQFKSPSSPAPGPQVNNRASYQQHPQIRQSVDMGLSPPPGGHTAAALAKSMDEFHRQSSRDQRQSVNYSSFAEDIVGSHPSSRPASPAATSAPRAPSPAMMQAPRQPDTHIADEVLSQYHQAFPGERQSRSRAGSRAGSIRSGRSRAGSINTQAPPAGGQQPPPSPGRQGFAGIGAGGGRSPSPQPAAFRSPSPSPQVGQGSLGPQTLGITLDEKGGVAHDSMAEAYRRQYQQSQQDGGQYGGAQPGRPTSAYGGSQAGYGGQSGHSHGHQPPPQQQGQQFPHQPPSQQNQYQRSASPAPPAAQQSTQYFPAYSPVQPQQAQPPQQQQTAQQPPPGPAHWQRQSQQSMSPAPVQQAPQQQAYGGPAGGYGQQSPAQPQYGGYQQQPPPQQQPQQHQQYNAPPQQNQYARSASPAPQHQHQQQHSQSYGYRAPSPQPQQQQYQPPPQQQQPQQQMRGRTPSPQPGVAPQNAAPTGQWSTSGLPVLFYVKALYDYQAQSAAEFDFQAGDIIAVTNTPEDGWWSGELLDEARRQAGRTDFPSNL